MMYATLEQHRAFWASEETDGNADERIQLIAEMAANIREDAAPVPPEDDEDRLLYAGKARGAELWIAQFIGARGLIKSATSGSGAKIDNDTWDEAMKIARQAMGKFSVAPVDTPGPSGTGYVSTFPFSR